MFLLVLRHLSLYIFTMLFYDLHIKQDSELTDFFACKISTTMLHGLICFLYVAYIINLKSWVREISLWKRVGCGLPFLKSRKYTFVPIFIQTYFQQLAKDIQGHPLQQQISHVKFLQEDVCNHCTVQLLSYDILHMYYFYPLQFHEK